MRCWANTLFTVIIVGLGTLAMLGACGQKGDLYLPESAPTSRASDVPTAPNAAQP